jgi:tetratricopeptide (TPR) repeat protein
VSARVLVQAGRSNDAATIARRLDADLHPHSRTYAHLIDGDIARAEHRLPQAVDAYRAAQKTTDLWVTRYALGIAYLEAGHFAEALAELEAADKRRGEATAVFLDDVPSMRCVAYLPYWLGRAQEAVHLTPLAADNYTRSLRLRDPAKDPLARDAAARLKALAPQTPPR